jgi:hypothetical protein
MRSYEFTNEDEDRDLDAFLNIGRRFVDLEPGTPQSYTASETPLTDIQKYKARVKKNRGTISNTISDKVPGAKYVLPFMQVAKDFKNGKGVGFNWSTGF